MTSDFTDPSGHRQRLREKYKSSKFTGFADYEIIEHFLTFSVPRKDVKPLAKSLIARYGNLKGVFNAGLEDLSNTPGVSELTAVLFDSMREAFIINATQKLAEEQLTFESTRKLIQFFKLRLEAAPREIFEILCLGPDLRLLHNGAVRICEGTADCALVEPRIIIDVAIKKKAAALVIAHNHPKEKAAPSPDDIIFTKRLGEACKSIGIPLIEHIVIGQNDSFSFRETGLLENS